MWSSGCGWEWQDDSPLLGQLHCTATAAAALAVTGTALAFTGSSKVLVVLLLPVAVEMPVYKALVDMMQPECSATGIARPKPAAA